MFIFIYYSIFKLYWNSKLNNYNLDLFFKKGEKMEKKVVCERQMQHYLQRFKELKEEKEENKNAILMMVIFLNGKIGTNYVSKELAQELNHLGISVLPTQIK